MAHGGRLRRCGHRHVWRGQQSRRRGRRRTERGAAIYYVQDNGEKRAALTFDAAWGNEDTEELIEILGRYDVKATFFLVGQWVDKYPESVKALADAGHEIENHSSTHPHLPQCSSEQIRQELEDCNSKIEAITGIAPKFHRCPYGDYDNNSIRTIRSIGMDLFVERGQLGLEGDHRAGNYPAGE